MLARLPVQHSPPKSAFYISRRFFYFDTLLCVSAPVKHARHLKMSLAILSPAATSKPISFNPPCFSAHLFPGYLASSLDGFTFRHCTQLFFRLYLQKSPNFVRKVTINKIRCPLPILYPRNSIYVCRLQLQQKLSPRNQSSLYSKRDA